MTSRTKKFLSYYKPYLGVFISVMISAILVAGITLLFPLLTRYITKTVLESGVPNALNQNLSHGSFDAAAHPDPYRVQLLRGLSRSCHGRHDGK